MFSSTLLYSRFHILLYSITGFVFYCTLFQDSCSPLLYSKVHDLLYSIPRFMFSSNLLYSKVHIILYSISAFMFSSILLFPRFMFSSWSLSRITEMFTRRETPSVTNSLYIYYVYLRTDLYTPMYLDRNKQTDKH